MANSELSKLKILFMYDYFRTRVNAFDENNSVTVNELIGYLEQKTGTTFERKSIYADISKINEYVSMTQKLKYGDSWISSEGKKYRKNQLEDEITVDEARLIVDAISTTTFVDTELCHKIINLFPEYFDANYQKRALIPHDEKISKKKTFQLNAIREGIEKREARKITYGYKLGGELTEKTDRIISPLALDWENNCYYVIAVDNQAVKAEGLERDRELTKALRRYRFDRIANVYYDSDPYIDYKNDKLREQELKSFLDNSVSAFSSQEAVSVELTITGGTRKDVLKAYGAFASRISNSIRIEDDTKLDKGILKIMVRTGHAPTLFTDLFELSTFENVVITINNDDVCREYGEYIKKAARAAKLASL
ncbi:MAG: WYL domain-containing protein [Saccharofermentans sp.]|nr:WYL domain-containing protein [Saccharofermentans sp.]